MNIDGFQDEERVDDGAGEGESEETFGLGGSSSNVNDGPPAEEEIESFGLGGFGLGGFSSALQEEAQSVSQYGAAAEEEQTAPAAAEEEQSAPVAEDPVATEEADTEASGGGGGSSWSPRAPVSTTSNSYGMGSSYGTGSYMSPSSEETEKPKPKFGGGDPCVRCKKTVYAAECRDGPDQQKYHK